MLEELVDLLPAVSRGLEVLSVRETGDLASRPCA
jgi:hypothetical protein